MILGHQYSYISSSCLGVYWFVVHAGEQSSVQSYVKSSLTNIPFGEIDGFTFRRIHPKMALHQILSNLTRFFLNAASIGFKIPFGPLIVNFAWIVWEPSWSRIESHENLARNRLPIILSNAILENQSNIHRILKPMLSYWFHCSKTDWIL
jgi:hypothetical protein